AITLVIFFIALALVIWKILIPTYFPGTIPNYAQEVSKPLEIALVNAGAEKKCTYGSNGHGFNNEPWTSSFYELPLSREQTVSIISKAAVDNGYNLKHANSDNKGPILADDKHIDNWYYDLDKQH